MAREVRDRFDPAADFAVARPFIAAGRRFDVGDPFDKSLCETRRLRQMYDMRQLVQLPRATTTAVKARPAPAVEPQPAPSAERKSRPRYRSRG